VGRVLVTNRYAVLLPSASQNVGQKVTTLKYSTVPTKTACRFREQISRRCQSLLPRRRCGKRLVGHYWYIWVVHHRQSQITSTTTNYHSHTVIINKEHNTQIIGSAMLRTTRTTAHNAPWAARIGVGGSATTSPKRTQRMYSRAIFAFAKKTCIESTKQSPSQYCPHELHGVGLKNQKCPNSEQQQNHL
jgi:hypothetical protein